jgi:hypothetical protein
VTANSDKPIRFMTYLLEHMTADRGGWDPSDDGIDHSDQ